MIAVFDIVNLIVTIILSIAALIISIYEITSAKKSKLLNIDKEKKAKEALNKLVEFQSENIEFKNCVYECSCMFDVCQKEMSNDFISCLINDNLQNLINYLYNLQNPVDKFLNKSNDIIFYTLSNSEFLPQSSVEFVCKLESKRNSLENSFNEMIIHTKTFASTINGVIELLKNNIFPDKNVLDLIANEYNEVLDFCKKIEKNVSEIQRITELLHKLVNY